MITLEGCSIARCAPIKRWAMAGLHFHPNGREGMEYTLHLTPMRTMCTLSSGTLQDQKQLDKSSLQK